MISSLICGSRSCLTRLPIGPSAPTRFSDGEVARAKLGASDRGSRGRIVLAQRLFGRRPFHCAAAARLRARDRGNRDAHGAIIGLVLADPARLIRRRSRRESPSSKSCATAARHYCTARSSSRLMLLWSTLAEIADRASSRCAVVVAHVSASRRQKRLGDRQVICPACTRRRAFQRLGPAAASKSAAIALALGTICPVGSLEPPAR